jgi:AcrR family transcriptional regulator
MSVLGATNRVFYNRFRNADEVLRIVYQRAVEQTRENIRPDYTDCRSFVDFCLDTAERVLVRSYDIKLQFRRYVFEHDSLTEENRLWWDAHIREQYRIARERGYVRDVDLDALCYALWCFCRGYITDAAARSVSLADSVRNFRFGFRCLLGGVLTASALQEISE